MSAMRLRVASVLLLSGCSTVLTPRSEDASALPDSYRQATAPPVDCEPMVELLRSAAEVRRPYRQVADLSATCYPGAPRVCEQRLLARACQLHATAVVLSEPTAEGTPPGASGQSRVSMSGRAVRWSD